MSGALQYVIGTAGVIAIGTAYVLIHEKRRKAKKARKAARDAPASKQKLLEILHDSAELLTVEKVQQMKTIADKRAQDKNLTPEQSTQHFSELFQANLDHVIQQVRNMKQVSEKSMNSAFEEHQRDPAITEAVNRMRRKSVIGPQLSKQKVREIMQYQCDQVEKELNAMRKDMDRARKAGRQPETNRTFAELDHRVAQKVHKKYGVTVDQWQMAVNDLGMKDDEEIQRIQQKLAQVLTQYTGQ